MDNFLVRYLNLINPNSIKSLILMGGGIFFLLLPCGFRLGKIPSILSLFSSGALLAVASAPLKRWEIEYEIDQKLLRAERQVSHATLTAQTLSAVQIAKQKYLPQTYDPQSITAQVKAELSSALPSIPNSSECQFGSEVEPSTEPPLLDLRKLLNTTLLMIWGTQGGGKTTLAKMLCRMREGEGHSVIVADPHGSPKEWGAWEIIGSGRDYKMLNEYLKHFDEAITADYKKFSSGQREFPYRTLIVDEFTQWADRCKHAPMFIKSACSNLRKLRRCVVLITHSDTITGLGNAQGLRAAIDRSAVKLELETILDDAGEYQPTGYGWLQYPNQQRQRVKVPRQIQSVSHDDRLPDEQLDRIASEIVEESYLDPREQLQKMWNLSSFNPDHESPKGLSIPAQAILDKYIQKKMFGTWIDSRWVKSYVFYTKILKSFSHAQAKGFLIELADSGKGVIEGEDKSFRWMYDQKDVSGG
jgi:hypothetical protein